MSATLTQTAPFLRTERQTLARLLPDLAEHLDATPLLELEQRGGDAIERFRAAGGPGLLVPADRGGSGAGALDAVRVQRAVGSRSPSLAAATTMHHFSLAALLEYLTDASEVEWLLVEGLARERLLLASGGSEGKTGKGILDTTMTATPVDGGYLVNGVKKPCSLATSMDILTCSLSVRGEDGEPAAAVGLVPAQSPGIERHPFWGTWVLDGAQSDEVRLTDVFVPNDLVILTGEGDPDGTLHARGFVWFEMLITASYLGAASALVERVVAAGRGDDAARVELVSEVEAAAAALEAVAHGLERGDEVRALLARSLHVRYALHRMLPAVAARAVEALGGMAFIASSEIAYLTSATQAVTLHPPSRRAGSAALARFLEGEELVLR